MAPDGTQRSIHASQSDGEEGSSMEVDFKQLEGRWVSMMYVCDAFSLPPSPSFPPFPSLTSLRLVTAFCDDLNG